LTPDKPKKTEKSVEKNLQHGSQRGKETTQGKEALSDLRRWLKLSRHVEKFNGGGRLPRYPGPTNQKKNLGSTPETERAEKQ